MERIIFQLSTKQVLTLIVFLLGAVIAAVSIVAALAEPATEPGPTSTAWIDQGLTDWTDCLAEAAQSITGTYSVEELEQWQQELHAQCRPQWKGDQP